MSNSGRTREASILGATLAIGIAIGCLAFGRSLTTMRTADRYVTVRGLVERDVAADLDARRVAEQFARDSGSRVGAAPSPARPVTRTHSPTP